MMRPLVTISPCLFRNVEIDWDIDWRAQSTGLSTSGRRHVHLGLLPRWVGAPRAMMDAQQIADWRAHRWAGRGAVAIYRVAMTDPVVWRVPLPDDGAAFSDGSLFSDGSGWDDAPKAPCVGGVVPGDTEIVLDESSAPQPVAVGQILSYGDLPFGVTWREDLGGGHVRLGVEMPIRIIIPAGGLVDLVGKGLFELVDPAQGNAIWSRSKRRADVSMRLQEWLR